MFYKVFFILIFFVSTLSNAQFLNEIGIIPGGVNYSGDIGREMYIFPNTLGGSFIYRRNLNERLTIRGTFSYMSISDDDKSSSNSFRQERALSFDNRIMELAAGIEMNFLAYDITSQNKGFSPYLFFEIAGINHSIATGGVYGNINYSNDMSLAIPVGIGIKTRMSKRLSINTELRVRYALTDELDYTTEDLPNFNIGNPNTNDWYFFTGIGITYSFQRPPCAVAPKY